MMIFFYLMTLPLAAISFRDFLMQGKEGDYVVGKSGKTTSLLHIHHIDEHSVFIEEIATASPPPSWKEWVSHKAPGHTSWVILELDLETGKAKRCYSFSKGAYIQVEASLLATLMQQPLLPVSWEQQRRIGPSPLPGEMDVRKIWKPSLVFEGKKVDAPQFEVFTTEVDGNKITLYFDQEKRVHLPYWVEAETPHMRFRFHSIESGCGLRSPYHAWGRKMPEEMSYPKNNPYAQKVE
jgi:hypothetical protein